MHDPITHDLSLDHPFPTEAAPIGPLRRPGEDAPSEPKQPIDQRIEAHLRELEELAAEWNAIDGDGETPVRLDCPPGFRLSIVVPVFNERATIRQILARLWTLEIPKEIVVVDDGSTDGTREQLKQLEGLPHLRLFWQDRNRGKGAALRRGFEEAGGQIILIQDADLEYDPRDIPRLVQPILAGEADVVFGSRFLEPRHRGSSRFHQFGNRLLTTVSNLTTGLQLTDMETCYKVFRRQVLSDLTLQQDRFGFEPEITAKIARRGYRVREVPVRYSARRWEEGKKIGVRDGLEALYCIARYGWSDD